MGELSVFVMKMKIKMKMKMKAYALVLKRPRYGDDKKGDIVEIHITKRLAQQKKHPKYHKIVAVEVTML